MSRFNFSDCQSADELIGAVLEAKEELDKILNELNQNVPESYETLEQNFKRQDAQPQLRFIPTGLFWLDNQLAGNGIAEGSFINVAGASFAGKTFFVLTLLQKLANSQKVAFFSYEMYEKVLYRKLRFTGSQVRKNMILIQDQPYLDVIERRIRDLSRQGIKVIAIDSRMKIQTREKMDDYIKNVAISAVLSRVCRETGAIVLLINQMNEADLKTGRLSLKGGNDQVYDSDMIFFITYSEDNKERILHCTKDRLSDSGGKWRVKIPHFTPNPYGAQTMVEFREEAK